MLHASKFPSKEYETRAQLRGRPKESVIIRGRISGYENIKIQRDLGPGKISSFEKNDVGKTRGLTSSPRVLRTY
jgi:hypothetical protein